MNLNASDIDEAVLRVLSARHDRGQTTRGTLVSTLDGVLRARLTEAELGASLRRLADQKLIASAAGDTWRLTKAPQWVVWRQDDNGNRAKVSHFADRSSAEAEAARLEALGHKQTYWVTQAE